MTYLNDGNAGALWGHFVLFGGSSKATSVSTIIGTGLGGGVIAEGNVVKGKITAIEADHAVIDVGLNPIGNHSTDPVGAHTKVGGRAGASDAA